MHHGLRKLVIILACVGLTGFFANLLVDNPYTHRLVRLIINEQVTKHTNLSVNFQALKLSLFPTGIDLYGLKVSTSESPDAPIVSVSQMRATLSIWSLILGELRLADVELNDPTFIWPPPEGFKSLLKDEATTPKAASTTENDLTWPPKFDLPVRRVALHNAKIYLEQPIFTPPQRARHLAVSVGALDAIWEYNSWRDMRLNIDSKGLDLSMGPQSMLESTRLAAKIKLNDKLISVSDLAIDGERLSFLGDATGELRVSDKRKRLLQGLQLSLSSKGHADMSILGSYLEIEDTHGRIDGDFRLDLDIPFTGDGSTKFKVAGSGKSNDARLYGFRLFDAETGFVIDEDKVRLQNINVIIDGKSVIKGGGDLKLNKDLDFDFRLNASELRLVDLLESLNVDSRIADLSLSTQDLHVTGKGDPFTLSATANAQTDDIIIPSIKLPRSKFPDSPKCQADLHLLVTAAQLDFTGTKASCTATSPVVAPTLGTGPGSQTARSSLQVSGGLKFALPGRTDIRILSSDADLRVAQYFAQVALSGTGRLETRISGPFDHLVIDTRLTQDNVRVAHIPLGAVSGHIRYTDDILSWLDLEAYPHEGGSIELATGTLDIARPEYLLDTEVDITDLSRDVVRAIATAINGEQDFSAEVKKLSGRYKGPLLQLLAGEAKLGIVAKDLRLNGETLVSLLDTTIQSDQQGWHTQSLVLKHNSLTLLGKVHHKRSAPFDLGYAESSNHPLYALGLRPTDKVNITFRTIAEKGPLPSASRNTEQPDDHLSHLPFTQPYFSPLGIKGLIVGQGEFSGTLDTLQGSFTASIEQPEILGTTMTALNLRGFVRGGHLELVINQGGNALDGRFSVDLMQKGLPYYWYLSCHRYDLRVLAASILEDDPRNYIYFTGDWNMQGKLTDFWHSVGELRIDDLRGNYVNDLASQTRTIQIRQDQPVKLLFTQRGWHFENNKDLFLSGKYMQIRLSTKDSRPPERLGLYFESVVDAGIIKEFVQDVDTAEGKLSIIGSLFGSTSDPKPNIEFSDLGANELTAATWRPLSIGFSEIRPAFRNIKMKAAYRDGRMVIDRLMADKGTGTVQATGSVNIDRNKGTESHLDINLKDATIIYPVAVLKNFESQISGNLVLSGQGSPYKLAGDININRARTTREVDIRSEIINVLRQRSISAATIAEKPTFTFDLNVNANQSINIHNRNLQVQMSTDLRIKGTDVNPVLSGQIEVDKGKFTYKQDFKITRGLVIFDDPIKPDPSLDILAVSDVDTYRVFLSISGRASSPTVEFSVDPPTRNGVAISKLEILVLLSRGKLPQDTQSMGQQTQSAATSEAANLLLGQFEEPVEKLLDVSGQNVVRNVYIDTHPAPDGSPVPRLNLPFELGENMDLVLRTDQATSQVTVEYNLNESIYVSGIHEVLRNKDALPTQNTPGNIEGDSRVNLKFRFSFD